MGVEAAVSVGLGVAVAVGVAVTKGREQPTNMAASRINGSSLRMLEVDMKGN